MKEFMLNAWGGFKKFYAMRQNNATKYKATNLLLLLCFPIFIISIAEINQMKSVPKFLVFLFERPTVMLFNLIIASLIFIGLLFLFKKGWMAMTLQSVLYFVLSCVELFKFNSNGNHLVLTDMKMAANLGVISDFAYIKITPMVVICLLLVLAYILAAAWFNSEVRIKIYKRLITSVVSIASVFAIILVPALANNVYAFFDVDTSQSLNIFKLNEKFDNNNFLAFFCQTATENINNKVKKPDNYSKETINGAIKGETTDNPTFEQPNVIVIMSEAFADFRRFEELEIPEDIYADFDAIRNEGVGGTAIVPTFASFTVRTEFELNFGLPVRSLRDPNMPQRLLPDRDQPTIARYFGDMGYFTNYVHSFSSGFYSRQRVYSYFGFDNMIFDHNFTVPVERYGSYISDTTIFNQIKELLKSDEPTFVHTTTMQNHQPYNSEDFETEFDCYLAGLKDMLGNLRDFTTYLKSIDEPTAILFVGDHYPSFAADDSVYDMMEVNGDNCNTFYEQEYFMWANYDVDYSNVTKETVSTFYLPYILLDTIGAPKDEFIETMLEKMKEMPIYSTSYDNTLPFDEALDLLTYDRILGDQITMNKPEDKNE